MKKRNMIYMIITLIFAIFTLGFLLKSPSNERNWSEDQKILPYAEIKGNEVTIYNIRNNTYRNTSDYDVKYYNKTYNLSELENLHYMVEHFSSIFGLAHTLLKFEFENGDSVAISIEIRKEKGEEYSPFKGLFREYEIMNVIADPKDVIDLRTKHRNNTVYLYPIQVSKKTLKELFVSMLENTNSLVEKPRFYNTLTSTCTTNLVDTVNKIKGETFISKYNYKILFPGYSDEILFKKGLIKTNLTDINKVREEFKIN